MHLGPVLVNKNIHFACECLEQVPAVLVKVAAVAAAAAAAAAAVVAVSSSRRSGGSISG